MNTSSLAKILWFYGFNYSDKKIICPFHADEKPSMLIDINNDSWFCFGCQKGGNAVDFVKLIEKQYNGLNDLEAYKKYYKILKSDKCKKINIKRCANSSKNNKQNKQLYAESYNYYHGLKSVNWDNPEFEEEKEQLNYMLGRGFNQYALTQAKAKITYNKSYGLIFPILDNGKFRGWVCRTNRPEIEAKRKYLYNEGFRRANTVVGNYGTKDYIIIVEGFMDRLKFIQYGVENVVSIFGWKLSEEQKIKLQNAGIKTFISALDNDECGRKGTEHLKCVFGVNNVIRFSYLKGIKDVGEATETQFNKMYSKTMKNYNALIKQKKGNRC